MSQPKVLIVDIETWPLAVRTWGTRDQNIALNQIEKDWSILAWAAKWRGEKKVYYYDTGNQKDLRNDKKILKPLWKLMDEADIIVGQNSDRFDLPRILSRFMFHKIMKRRLPSDFQKQDTMKMAKKFHLTSYKLEYMAKYFGLKNQKMVKRQFVGQELWNGCEDRNPKAWAEMRKYNPQDILTTEELFEVLLPHDKKVNYSVFDPNNERCSCGSFILAKWGVRPKNGGVYQRYICKTCGKYHYGKTNLLPKLKKENLLK
jgi:DNA polymerase elongation subunit (family B)